MKKSYVPQAIISYPTEERVIMLDGGLPDCHKECLKVRVNQNYNFDSCECSEYGI